MLSKDMEQDVVPAPAAYWRFCRKAKMEKLLSRKLRHGRHVKCDDTNVIASMNDPSERDLTKRFYDIDRTISISRRDTTRLVG
jgi:hypothetical protein